MLVIVRFPAEIPVAAMLALVALAVASPPPCRGEPATAIPVSAWPIDTDYSLMSWMRGFPGRIPGAPWHRCIRTGRYAFVLDTRTMQVPHMGPIESESYATAVRDEFGSVSSLPPADLGLFVRVDGAVYRCTAGRPWDRLAGPRLIASGRWVQRADVDGLVFTADDGRVLNADARLETVAWPDRLAVIMAVRPGLEPIPGGDACFGRVGGGFGLTGKNHLEIPHSPRIDPEQFTLECQVYVPSDHDAATKAHPWLVCKNFHEAADGNYGISVEQGTPRARLNIGGGAENAFSTSDGGRLVIEAWNHLAMTYDGATLRLYLNGKFHGEKRIDRQRRPGKQGLAFGRRQDAFGDGYHFRGAVDEIRIYDRPLSADQIQRRFLTPEKPLADAPASFIRSFREEGPSVMKRSAASWWDAALAIRLKAGETTLKRHVPIAAAPAAEGWHEVSLAFDPTAVRDAPEADHVESSVRIEAVPLGSDGTPQQGSLPVLADTARGWQRISLDDVAACLPPRTAQGTPAPHHLTDSRNDVIERVRLTLANPSSDEQTARLLFEKTTFGRGPRIGSPITGISAILRDADGHPTGIPVQLSKNWHGRREDGPYTGQWFHGFSQVRLPAVTTIQLELVLAYGHWGGVPAASHAQLCLVGWGSNQHWDESALGSWGESICYEPDQVQAQASILDVRPLLVRSKVDDKPWQWTGNVGGGDFLRIFGPDGSRIPHRGMKAAYHRYGPCLTEVTYAGQVGTAIDHAETVSLVRSGDLLRGIYRIRMDVRDQVDVSRCVIFQIGADTYSYARERTMASGDASGLIRQWATRWGGDTYHDRPSECTGTAPWWVSLHDAEQPQEPTATIANRGIVIREWKAVLGGRSAQPWLAEHGNAAPTPSSTLDVLPPPGVDRLVPGDFVEATIEHLAVPLSATNYYGPDEALHQALSEGREPWHMVLREAVGNHRQIEPLHGTLVHAYPDIRIAADQGRAAFRVSGGSGHVPITFTGLSHHRGGTLSINGAPIDQAVHGADFWQTDYDSTTQTWAQTFTVPLPTDGPCTVTFEQPPRP